MAFRPLDDTRIAEQADMLANRVAKTFRRLQRKFEAQSIGAFRLYDWDIPEIRAAVDWYEGHLVCAEYERTQTQAVDDWIGKMAARTAAVMGVPSERVHVKTRRTRPPDGPRYERLQHDGQRFAVREGALRFLVNLDDFLDTGLFPDHRLTRVRVGKAVVGKRFLNLFCYTGSFTCYAAQGGAARSVSVDASKTYLAWAADNLALNDLGGPRAAPAAGAERSEPDRDTSSRSERGAHELIKEDVREFLQRAKTTRQPFDVCVVDPPSFSSGGTRDSWDVQRDHPVLLQQVIAVMAKGGSIYFSTNHQRFTPEFAGLTGVHIEDITAETIPEDYRNKAVHRCFLLHVE